MQILVPLDLTKNELRNVLLHVLATDPASPLEGQVYYNSVDDTIRYYTGAAWRILGRLDQISPPTAQVDMGGQKVVNVGTPTAAGDAVTKNYVDSMAQGVNWKDSVRAATVSAGTLASSFANGSVIDGVTLVTGDRLLIKNQASPQENGIYTTNASGAPTRATDADTAGEIQAMAVLVEEGTTNADSLWVCTANAPITVGTTPLPFVQIGASTGYVAGNGLSLTGNTFAVVAKAGGGLVSDGTGVYLSAPVTVPNGGTGATTLPSNGVLLGNGVNPVTGVTGTTGQVLRATAGAPAFGQVDLANSSAVTGILPITNGGTGASSAQAARAALGVPAKFAQAVGDNSATTIAVTHNLGTRDVSVSVYRSTTPYDVVYPDIQMTDNNTVTLIFSVAPSSGQFRVVVTG